MEYTTLKLQSELYGLTVRKPCVEESIAILDNLSESYNNENLRPILLEFEKRGIKRYVVDLSKYPEDTRRGWLAYLHGFIVGRDSSKYVRYTGINPESCKDAPDILKSNIAEDLEKAISSLITEHSSVKLN